MKRTDMLGLNWEEAIAVVRSLEDNVDTLRKAMRKVEEEIIRFVPDGYSQPCVDDAAEKCDAIIHKALEETDEPRDS